MSLDEGNKRICRDIWQQATFCASPITTTNRTPEIQVNVSTDFRASDAVIFLLRPLNVAAGLSTLIA